MRVTLQLLLTPPVSPLPPPFPCSSPFTFLFLLLLHSPSPSPFTSSCLPTLQQVMGQLVLRAEQRGDGFLQGRQEHHHALQQRAAAQPLPLPLRRHQWLQEEEERLHAQVRGCFHTHVYCFVIVLFKQRHSVTFLTKLNRLGVKAECELHNDDALL